MSPKEKQSGGGCVTVEYSTEEKKELYELDEELQAGTTNGVMAWVFRELIDK